MAIFNSNMEKVTAPHSSTLAWEIPWLEEPGRLLSTGSLWVGHDWATSLSLFTFTHWRRKWQPTPVFLPWESQGRGSLVGCPMGPHRVRHDWSDLVAAAACSILWGVYLGIYILENNCVICSESTETIHVLWIKELTSRTTLFLCSKINYAFNF